MGLPLTWRLLPARREAAARVNMSVLRFCTMKCLCGTSVARPGETPQAATLEAVMGFEVRNRISTFLRSSQAIVRTRYHEAVA